ncbi:MAG: hypothetical protein ACRDLE_13605 [Gaiellaceae bacterium]
MILALSLLHGVVVRGPTAPVCMTGKPCTEPAVGAVLVFSRNGGSKRVRVGAGGRYSVRLVPGAYTVRQAPAPKIGFGMRPDRVVVRRTVTRADFSIDTGIR